MDLLLSPCRSCLQCLPFFNDSLPPSPVRHSKNTAEGSDPATAVAHEHDLPVSEGCTVEVFTPADSQPVKRTDFGLGHGEASTDANDGKTQGKTEVDAFFSANDAVSSTAVTAQSGFVDQGNCEDVSSKQQIGVNVPENGHHSNQNVAGTGYDGYGDDNSFNQQNIQDEASFNIIHLQHSNDECSGKLLQNSSSNLDQSSSEDNGRYSKEEVTAVDLHDYDYSLDAGSVQNSASFSTSEVMVDSKKDSTSSSDEGGKGANSGHDLTVKPANDAGKSKGKKKQRRRDRIRNQIAGLQQQLGNVMNEEGIKNQLAGLQQQLKYGGHAVKEEGSKHLRNMFNNVSKQAHQIEESAPFYKRHQNN